MRRFLPAGNPRRENAQCPVCGSLERHRLDWVFLAGHTNLFDGTVKRMLHVAPEKFLSVRFRSIPGVDYVSADLMNPRAMIQMDITDIKLPDETFSVIYCSHVLEHIPNDRKAIAEMYRVLRHVGWGLLQVPISAEQTYEDPAVVDPEERKKHFGQWDHVRRCGPDYIERLRSVGFEVQLLRATDLLTESERARLSVPSDRLLFYCRKPLLL